MSITVGLDVSDYSSLDSDLELTAQNSQVRLKKVDANLIALATYNTDDNFDFDVCDGVATGKERGSVTVSGGVLNTGGTGAVEYTVANNFQANKGSVLLRFTPNWSNNPATYQWLFTTTDYTTVPAVEIIILNDGKARLRILDAALATKASIESSQISWDTGEEEYLLATWDWSEGANGTARFFYGRVSGGTAALIGTDDDLGTNDPGTVFPNTLYVGALGNSYRSDADFNQVAIFDNVQQTANHNIPALITTNYATDDPEWVGNEIDLEGSRTVDMSEINIIENPNSEGGSEKYQYSCHDTSGSPSWNGSWLSLANLQAESDPTGKYFQLKAQFTSTGVQKASIAETANFLSLGSATGTAPNTPTSLSWADNGDGTGGSITLTIDSIVSATTVYYRKRGASSWSTQSVSGTGVQTQAISITTTGYYEFVATSSTASGGNSVPSLMILGVVSNAQSLEYLIGDAIREAIDVNIANYTVVLDWSQQTKVEKEQDFILVSYDGRDQEDLYGGAAKAEFKYIVKLKTKQKGSPDTRKKATKNLLEDLRELLDHNTSTLATVSHNRLKGYDEIRMNTTNLPESGSGPQESVCTLSAIVYEDIT